MRATTCVVISGQDTLEGVRLFLVLLLTGCAADRSTPRYPAFDGQETIVWLAYELDVPGRKPGDLLPAFDASAQAHGCRTEPIGAQTSTSLGGEVRESYGVTASCDEGTIALVTLVGDRVRIGCPKPTTREQCDALLQSISEAR